MLPLIDIRNNQDESSGSSSVSDEEDVSDNEEVRSNEVCNE